MATFISHSAAETFAWAKTYSAALRPSDVVLLEGGMGAGKTVLAQGIIAGMGIPDEVTSPTYAYVNSYGGGRVFHFDCYRIACEEQAVGLGFCDYFEEDAICLIEWGENIRGLLPENCKRIRITGEGDGPREIES